MEFKGHRHGSNTRHGRDWPCCEISYANSGGKLNSFSGRQKLVTSGAGLEPG